MRKLLAVLAVVLASTVLIACGGPKEATAVPDKPSTDIYVVDNANMLNDAAKQHIVKTGRELDKRCGAQVVVLTVDSVDGDLAPFATDVFRKWGIGDKEKNNGVLLLISKNDHKFRIEVGYGLEGRLPDSYVGTVLDKMKGKFKAGDYSTGTTEAYDILVSEIYKEFDPSAAASVVAEGHQDVHESGFLTSMILWFLALTLIEQGGVLVLILIVLAFLLYIGALDVPLAIIGSDSSGGGFGGGSSGGGGCSDDW